MNTSVEDAIESVQIAALDLLDLALTPWQRAKAEEIYELTNELQGGPSD